MDKESPAVTGLMHDDGAKVPPKRVKTMIITHHPPTKEHPYQHMHITHHHSHSAHPAETHIVPVHQGDGLDQLHDHLEEHMGQPNEGEQECEDGNCE
jgi:hypothetical protein